MKTVKKYLFLVTCVLVFSESSFGQDVAMPDTAGNYSAVKYTIEQSIGWAVEKDFEAMYKLYGSA